MLIEIHTISFKKMHLKMSSGKWQPFCLSLNVLIIGILSAWSLSSGSDTRHVLAILDWLNTGAHLLTWIYFNPNMDK